MMRSSEGGTIRFNYENPLNNTRIRHNLYYNIGNVITVEEIIHYKNSELTDKIISKPFVDEFDREEYFPCINEQLGPVDLSAEYSKDNNFKVKFTVFQDNGDCWINDSALNGLENIIGINLMVENNNLIGDEYFNMIDLVDSEGNLILYDNVGVSIGLTDPRTLEYYKFLLIVINAWEYARRQIKPSVLL